jgi:hypothetical protein
MICDEEKRLNIDNRHVVLLPSHGNAYHINIMYIK